MLEQLRQHLRGIGTEPIVIQAQHPLRQCWIAVHAGEHLLVRVDPYAQPGLGQIARGEFGTELFQQTCIAEMKDAPVPAELVMADSRDVLQHTIRRLGIEALLFQQGRQMRAWFAIGNNKACIGEQSAQIAQPLQTVIALGDVASSAAHMHQFGQMRAKKHLECRVARIGAEDVAVQLLMQSRKVMLPGLRALRRRLRASQRLMLDDDIDFTELLRRSTHSLRLGRAQVWMTLWPSLLVAIPLLFLLSWMSNRFDTVQPVPAAAVAIRVIPVSAISELKASGLNWIDAADNAGCRQLTWPQGDAHGVLLENDHKLVAVPLQHPTAVIHQRRWWNRAFGNPLGYLPAGSPIDHIHFGLYPLEILPWGPGWLRGWIAPFLLVMTVLSLWLRWRWKLV